MKNLFKWQKVLEVTEKIKFKNHQYYLVINFHPHSPNFPDIPDSYSIRVVEDEYIAITENTQNPDFLSKVNTSKPIEEQIIQFGSYILKNFIEICDKCNERKIIQYKKSNTRLKEFKGINKICQNCRDIIFNEINEKFKQKQIKRYEKDLKRLKKNSPQIIGGFSKKYEAYKVLKENPNLSIENGESGFVYAKTILKANDNTYYPVFCVIDQSSGGELWDSLFIAKNYPDEFISQSLANHFFNKDIDSIYPYDYETLSIIPDDFHQDGEFRTMTFQNIRHHHTNALHTTKRKDVPEAIDYSAPIRLRTYFSLQHALSVCQFAKLARSVEENENSRFDVQDLSGHRSYCVSAILSAAAFLESTINEFFSDTLEYPERFSDSIQDNTISLLSKMWTLGIPRTATYSIIEKYQIALNIAGLREFDLSKNPIQDLVTLIKMRNALIHFEPSWHDTKDLTSQQISKKFQSALRGKFLENPLTGDNNPFFPDKCLSASMIQWLLKTIISVADQFSEKFEFIPMHEKIRNHIEDALSV